LRLGTIACTFTDLPVYFPAPHGFAFGNRPVQDLASTERKIRKLEPTISTVFSHPAAAQVVDALHEYQLELRHRQSASSEEIYLPASYFLPIFHHLSSMLENKRPLLHEGFRLSALLFVHMLRSMCWGSAPPLLLLRKLHHLLSSSDLEELAQDPALSWIIAVALSSGVVTSAQMICFTRILQLLVRVNHFPDFQSYMAKVVQITWDYTVLDSRTDILRNCFEEIVK
jgi:hypothetical protein